MVNFGNLIGLGFGIGLTFVLKPIFGIANKNTIFRNQFLRFTQEPDYAHKVVVSILSGSVCAFVFGVWSRNPILTIICLILGMIVGVKIASNNLKTKAIEYDLRLRIMSGTFIDVVNLCVSSGMPIRMAISESAQKSSGEIMSIWLPVTSDTTAEVPFLNHLTNISSENRENVMGRISRTLLIAQERGTPIAQTLNALSAEIRSETRRQLLEIAAKKDVTMMVPVVFGILPSITAIALYPAFISLSIM